MSSEEQRLQYAGVDREVAQAESHSGLLASSPRGAMSPAAGDRQGVDDSAAGTVQEPVAAEVDNLASVRPFLQKESFEEAMEAYA